MRLENQIGVILKEKMKMVENTTGFVVDAAETVWHIKFVQPGNRFAKELNEKIPELEKFIVMETHTVHAFDKFEQGLKVVFDDEKAPYIPDTMSKLKSTLHKIIGRINESEMTDAQFDIIRAIDSLLEYIDHPNNELGFEEEFYHTIFDEDRYPENPEFQKIIEDIRKALSKAKIGGKVSGEYKHNHKEITLYTRNINPTVEDYLSVFAHEFFHAFHHFCLDEMRSREKLNKYYHSVVLESLATFFQIEFLKHIKLIGKAAELQHSILKYSPIFYPYSGCRDLLNGKRDFIRVFEQYDDFEQALKNLVTWREAEIILKMDKKRNRFKDDVLNSVDMKGASVNNSGRKGGNSSETELIFLPDADAFKRNILEKGHAYIMLIYSSGKVEISTWNVVTLSDESNIRENIMTRPFWKTKKGKGLVKVIVSTKLDLTVDMK